MVFFFLPIDNLNYRMKYFNKNLNDNEIYKFIIQILGNSDTDIKLTVTKTSNVIVVDNQWKIIISEDDISIETIQVSRLVFKFSGLSEMDNDLIFEIKKVIGGILYSGYSNEKIFNLICEFNSNLSLLKKHISKDNQSHFCWFFGVSCYDGFLELLIGVYEPFHHIGDIRMVLNSYKILELVFSVPSGVTYICKDPNSEQKLIEFIIGRNNTLNNEKSK